MTPEEWDGLRPLFEHAIELPPEEREAFIDGITAKNEKQGWKLRELVRNHVESTAPVVSPAEGPPEDRGIRSFAVGEILLDRFRIVRFIGRGGMGEVYEASDKQLGRVALKTIRPELALDEHVMQRFTQEVQLARRITSPLVSRVHELFTVPSVNGRPVLTFLTMEYLDGMTLAERIVRDGALELETVESIAIQLCSALESIHKEGVVHRDLKPANIMLVERDGAVRVVVMDLGLARAVDGARATEAAASGMTRQNVVVGTPEFMAPEQFEGGPLTAAVDIYAFGLVFYFMLTGKSPFQGKSPIASAANRARRLPLPSSVRRGSPRHWDAVLERCLEYDPERRFQNVGELEQALREGESPIERVRRRFGRWTYPLLAAALLSLLLAAGAVVHGLLDHSPPVSPDAVFWFEKGSTALREATYVKATHAFERALNIDPDFALAHARLADAWAELDFTVKAKDAMLRASSLENSQSLKRQDREHIDAVLAMVTGDFPSAQRVYTSILKQAPKDEKAWPSLDLGRAYEKAGDAGRAMEHYADSARLAPEQPAAFVRLGILESRKGKVADAEKHFARANELYDASSNKEGVAEIDYQRGHFATLRGDLANARAFLEKSLHAARDISSAQLEVRSLIRLGVVEDLSDNLNKCIEIEDRAMALAKANKLDYWVGDGLIRVADAYQARGDLAKAEPLLREAARIAQESKMKRLEANVNLELASVRSRQNKPDEVISLARATLDYYRRAGFAPESVSASILIGRSEWDKGDLKAALTEGLQALQPAMNSSTQTAIMQVEELLGSVLLEQQEYPEALQHFQYALQAARTAGQGLGYQQVHCADALWRLGRYREADEMLASIPHAGAEMPGVIKAGILDVGAQMSLSRGDVRGALERARRGLNMKDLAPEYLVDFENVSALALAALHSVGAAKQASTIAFERSSEISGGRLTAESNLVAALVSLAGGKPDEARPRVETALTFFSTSGRKESEFRSLACMAQVMKSVGDSAARVKFSTKALDILAAFEHNWGTSTFQTYISRRDLLAERARLLTFAHQ